MRAPTAFGLLGGAVVAGVIVVAGTTGAQNGGHGGHGGHGEPVAPARAPPQQPDEQNEPEGSEGHEGHEGHAAPAPAAPSAPGSAPPPLEAGRDEPRAPVDVVPEQQTRIGLATAPVTRQSVRHAIRAVGSIVADERREAHVHTRVPGWIEDIAVSEVGAPVKRGQVLYRLYAPELVATQEEIVAARRHGELGRRLIAAALERLALWNVAPSEIRALRDGADTRRALAFVSPTSGFVIEKTAVEGMYVTPDMELYRIADLSRVWVIVSLYENEIALVKVGDEAEVALTSAPERTVRASVSYVYPELDVATRTGRARIELENPAGTFKPGMFANVLIEKDLGEAVVVPEDAVLFTGTRNLVFKKTTATRFQPVEVEVGPRTEAGRVVRAGLAPGDEVVVRATFLIDAESRLRAALERGAAPPGGHGGHGEHGGE